MQVIIEYLQNIEFTPALIALQAYIVIWFVAMLRCKGYKRLSKLVQKDTEANLKGSSSVSIIVTALHQSELLDDVLKMHLSQDHPNYEVIVVLSPDAGERKKELEEMQTSFPHLRVCQLPQQMRNISPLRMAYTLGSRTAEKDWLLFTDVTCCPTSRNWLARMTAHCTDGKEMVLGYTRFVNTKGYTGLCFRFFRIWQQMLNLTHAIKYGAYRASASNLLYKRQLFLDNRGFADHGMLLEGATDILVNTYSTKENTAVCMHPEGMVNQQCPNEERWWTYDRLFFMETRRYLNNRFGYRLRYALSVWFNRLYTLTTLTAIGIMFWFETLPYYPCAITVGVLWLTHGIWRTHCFNTTLRALGENTIHCMLPWLLHRIPWWDFRAWTKHKFTNKKTFRKKFV